MWATKETFVFAVLALVLAVVCAVGWTRWRGGAAFTDSDRRKIKFMPAAVAVAGAVAALFFSSFLTNPDGIAASVATYTPWLHRAEGVSPHAHPWNFYFERLLFYHANGGPVWSEGLIAALAVAGFVAALAGRWLGSGNVMLVRVIAFYTLWMTLIYTALPYKTPWCLLGFFHGHDPAGRRRRGGAAAFLQTAAG